MLVLEEITTTEALELIRPAWERLWEACPNATPFQSPAWLIPWWRHIGEGRLLTLAAREDGRLVALSPMYIYTDPATGKRQLFLLGMGTSDYLDLLVAPSAGDRAIAAIFERLGARAAQWDECVFSDLQEPSSLLAAPLPEGWVEQRSPCEVCPRLRLPRSGEALEHTLSKNLSANLRKALRRAEREGSVRWASADEHSLEEIFSAFLGLHGARWRSRGEAGVLSEERVLRAHRESVPALLCAGLLRLYALRIGERIVAAYYGLVDAARPERRAYAYLGGWDPRFSHLSPGTLIMGHAIREAVREGVDVFDFARGQEPYKYLWGATDARTYRRVLRRAAGGA